MFCFVLFFSQSVTLRARGLMLSSHSLTYLSLLLFCLRGKTLTRGVQMCETFYCKSGQTSQISGKFWWPLWVPKPERVRILFIVVTRKKKKFKIGLFLLIIELATKGSGENSLGILEYFICSPKGRLCVYWRAKVDAPQMASSD